MMKEVFYAEYENVESPFSLRETYSLERKSGWMANNQTDCDLSFGVVIKKAVLTHIM
jgi:hypothetical protein